MALGELHAAEIEVGLDAEPRGREAMQCRMRPLADGLRHEHQLAPAEPMRPSGRAT